MIRPTRYATSIAIFALGVFDWCPGNAHDRHESFAESPR